MDSRYLYYKISSIDANFKLSNRDSTGDDPGLSTGHAYFVPDNVYKHWISAQGKQTEVRVSLYLFLKAYIFSGINVYRFLCNQNGKYEEREGFTGNRCWCHCMCSTWHASSEWIGRFAKRRTVCH